MGNLLSSIWHFISRNPLATVILLLLIVAAPGVLGFLAVFILIMILLGAIPLLSVFWKVRNAQQTFRDNAADGKIHNDWGGFTNRKDGKVTIVGNPKASKRVKDDVGEYIDYKEIK